MRERGRKGENDHYSVHLSCSSTLKAHAKDSTCVDVSPTDAVVVTGGMDKVREGRGKGGEGRGRRRRGSLVDGQVMGSGYDDNAIGNRW